ncbi:DHA2 family efflux MFS transporter permease subunit [Micromonospora sp. C28SCA-DRY-2]|uniref:DHA2 family efflux MFS transporter permease subunit n=1 Tax=Micromonospora sp. C28SCA-DRY-2 TaxID=3059522 RepID=UPI002676EF98|nr:DHA2 family efflux MFS transporter permease subunit [Micromonospora sp. C28SCA-DRY-2]MDO3702700.1 DHA2 family efflux MFS transporter permease subunit [Micromonospora sp. C28SCA-DRY-2]
MKTITETSGATVAAPAAGLAVVGSAGRRRWAVLALLAVAQFAVVLDSSIMNIALPSIGDELRVSPENLSWVINAYVLAFGGFLLLGGRLADLLGRRRMFVAGLVLFAAASLVGGLATAAWQLIAARAVQGLGGALLAPAALSILTTIFPAGAERNKALGVWGAVAGSGAAAGVLLGGVLTDGLGWEWVLFINVPIGAATALLSLRLIPESRGHAGRDGFDLAGAATVTGGLTAAVYGIVEAESAGWAAPTTLGVFAAAAVLLGAFVIIERRATSPVLPFAIFRLRTVLGANVTMLFVGAAMFGLFYFLSLSMQQVLGYTPLQTGLAQLPVAGTLVVAAGLISPLVTRIGSKPVTLAGLAAFAAGLVWFSRMPADAGFVTDLLGPSLVVGVGLAATFVALTVSSVEGITDAESGLASGLINTTQQIGGALGLAALTAVAAGRTDSSLNGAVPAIALNEGFQAGLLVAAGIVAAAVALTAIVSRGSRPGGQFAATTPGSESRAQAAA